MPPSTELEWIKAVHTDVSALREEFSDMREDLATAKALEVRVAALESDSEERSRRGLLISTAFVAPLLTALIASGIAVAN